MAVQKAAPKDTSLAASTVVRKAALWAVEKAVK